MNAKQILKDTFWIYIITFFGAVAAYFTRVIYARNFSIEEYGLFYAVYGFVFLFAPLRDLGLEGSLFFYMSKFVAKKKFGIAKRLISFTLIPQLVLAVAISIGIFLFKDSLINNYFKNPLAGTILVILTILFLFDTIKPTLATIFGVFQKYVLYRLHTPLNSLLVFIISYILFRLNFGIKAPPLAYLLSSAIIILVYFILYLKTIPQLRIKGKPITKYKSSIIKYALSLTIAGFSGLLLHQMDIILLTAMKGVVSVGYYNIVIPSINIILMLVGPATTLLVPVISNLFHVNKISKISSLVSMIYNNILIFALPISIAFFQYSTEVVKILFGAKYLPAVLGLRIYSLFFIFVLIRNINFNTIIAMGKPKISSKILVQGSIFNLIIDIILIHFFDYVGAIIATCLSLVFMCYLSNKFLSKMLEFKIIFFKQLKIILSATLFFVSSFVLKKVINIASSDIKGIIVEAIIVFGVSSAIYVSSLFVLRATTKEEIKNAVAKILGKN